MRSLVRLGITAAVAALLGAPARAQCPGDCDGNGAVSIDEVVTGVNIGLAILPLDRCAAADGDGDGEVSIDEVIAALNYGLGECPAAPPTPSPTPTPVGV